MGFPRFKFKGRIRTMSKFPITGKKYMARDRTGAYVVVGKGGVVASYSPELVDRAKAHLKRLK